MGTRRRYMDEGDTRKTGRPSLPIDADADDTAITIQAPGKWSRTAITAVSVAVAIAAALIGIGVREGSITGRFEQVEARVAKLEGIAAKVDTLAEQVTALVTASNEQRRNIDLFWSTHWAGLVSRIERAERVDNERWEALTKAIERIERRRP